MSFIGIRRFILVVKIDSITNYNNNYYDIADPFNPLIKNQIARIVGTLVVSPQLISNYDVYTLDENKILIPKNYLYVVRPNQILILINKNVPLDIFKIVNDKIVEYLSQDNTIRFLDNIEYDPAVEQQFEFDPILGKENATVPPKPEPIPPDVPSDDSSSSIIDDSQSISSISSSSSSTSTSSNSSISSDSSISNVSSISTDSSISSSSQSTISSASSNSSSSSISSISSSSDSTLSSDSSLSTASSTSSSSDSTLSSDSSISTSSQSEESESSLSSSLSTGSSASSISSLSTSSSASSQSSQSIDSSSSSAEDFITTENDLVLLTEDSQELEIE